ncbi:9629_t:CDS:2 [Dentiscutata heterogama]|uniref:9629_t:CDS:1 n=1 Tax=Dentiscutata heterogama TaxID=1316150 RepID=A0ACA9KBR7_9GLOM|nr:9629_t:CDS:2 [Dentiscutata heterogama]
MISSIGNLLYLQDNKKQDSINERCSNKKQDEIYNFGIILSKIFKDLIPFERAELCKKCAELCDECDKLCKKCLHIDPNQRPMIKTVYKNLLQLEDGGFSIERTFQSQYGTTKKSFIFSLRNNNSDLGRDRNIENNSIFSQIKSCKKAMAIYYDNDNNVGPSFGHNGNDLSMINGVGVFNKWCCKQDCYEKPIKKPGNSGHFNVVEYEVFKVCKNRFNIGSYNSAK